MIKQHEIRLKQAQCNEKCDLKDGRTSCALVVEFTENVV